MKVIYETIDGKQFSQAADAEQHERKLNAQVKMWGFDGEPTTNCANAYVVYLKGDYAADLFKQMNEQCPDSAPVPDKDICSGDEGVWYWEEYGECYVPVTMKTAELLSKVFSEICLNKSAA